VDHFITAVHGHPPPPSYSLLFCRVFGEQGSRQNDRRNQHITCHTGACVTLSVCIAITRTSHGHLDRAPIIIYTVSQKNCADLFLLLLCQM